MMSKAGLSPEKLNSLNAELTPETDGGKGVSVSDILRALRQNKWLILACVVVGLLGAFVDIVITKPVYESQASIRIDPSLAGSLGLMDILGTQATDEQQTEIAILKSDGVALATLNSLTPEQFQKFAGFDKKAMNFNVNDQQMTRQQQSAITRLAMSFKVKQIEGTQLIQLSFRGGDPALSALMLNHIMDAYLRHNFDSRYNSVDQVRIWLDGQMEDLRTRAEKAQKQIADFEETNNFLGTDASNNTVVNNLKTLSDRLGEAEGQRILKEAAMRAADSGDPAILASLVPNAKLAALQSQEATLYAQEVQLSSKFGTGYPPLNDIKKQHAEVKSEIASNLNLISGRLREEFNGASLAESMLRNEYETAIDNAFVLNRKQTEYAVLLGEVSTNRSLYNTLQKSLQQATVDAGLNSVNTMIVDRARPPLDPVEPKKALLLSVGLVLGLTAGMGSALLREALTDVVRSIADIEGRTGSVSLAVVPHLVFNDGDRKTKPGQANPRLITINEPRSRGAEAYRTLRNSILLSSIDNPVRTVLVTSALPGEGKSSTCANYAVVLAQKGGRTLVVDADLRRPMLHNYFGVPNKDGLTSQLLRDSDLAEVVTPFPELPNLHFMPAGEGIPFPSEALGSSKYRSLLEAWGTQYDTILIDSAPVLAVSDSLPMASWVDTVVLVARAGVTPVRALIRARATLWRAQAHVAGVVLNDVSKTDEQYDYYGKGYNAYYN